MNENSKLTSFVKCCSLPNACLPLSGAPTLMMGQDWLLSYCTNFSLPSCTVPDALELGQANR